jgi:hypothetical protein
MCVITCPIGGCDYHGRAVPDAAGVAVDAAVDAGGTGIATCGKTGAVIDDFADGIPAYFWRVTSASYGDVAEVGGALVLTPAGGGAIGYTATTAVDLRDAGLEVEVPTMVTAGTGATAAFIAGNRGQQIGIVERDGNLEAVIDRATGGRLVNDVPYDPVMHRWWQIMDAGDRVSIKTSPDGVTWSLFLTGSDVDFTGAVQVALAADGNAAGSVSFRNLRASERGVAIGPAPWCKTRTFVDAFDGAAIDYAWSPSSNPAATCDPKLAGGKLHIDTGGSACAGYLLSMSLYDLGASSVVLDTDVLDALPYGYGALLGVNDPAGAKASISATNSQLCAVVGDYDYQCVGYTGQRYWRLRDDAGTLVWDASPDQVDWTQLRTYPGLLDLTRVRISIGAYQSYDGQAAIHFASPGLNP